MIIGINLLYIYPNAVGGTETYARGLIEGLREVDNKNEYILFCSRESTSTFRQSKNVKVVGLPVNSKNRIIRSLFEILIFPLYLIKYKINVVHSLGYSSPIISTCPTIVNIYDLNWYYHPEDFDFFRRIGWKFFVISSALFCTKIITTSKSSKQHISKILRIPKRKIKVVYGGTPVLEKPNSKSHLTKFGISGDYIFTLTADIPHKNILGLMKAYKKIVLSGRKMTLVVGGLKGKMRLLVEDYIKKNKILNNIILLSWLENRDLATLYKFATVFVIPSLHEGFGFTVLEAFKSGVPLVSSDAFSLKEVVGKAGLLFNPRNYNEMAGKIIQVYENPEFARKLSKLGIERLKDFSWENSAKETLQVYNSVN